MSENNSLPQNNEVYSANDALDINELASLNDDISPELIEQLQNKLSVNAKAFSGGQDNSDLFEEVDTNANKPLPNTGGPRLNIDDNIDDNFIKKYKAKLNKQAIEVSKEASEEKIEKTQPQIVENTTEQQIIKPNIEIKTEIKAEVRQEEKQNTPQVNVSAQTAVNIKPDKEIENLSGGNIIEKPALTEQLNYNESLDFLDNNIKYSKYVIYIDPENKEFIESLTVKERKNLINKILREQDDISITKKRFSTIQSIIRHAIVAILTISITIPIAYWTINASLEATINNHRRSQTIFKTLYREKGKIKSTTTSIH